MNTLDQVEALGGYKIILADPSWRYKNAGRGAASNHYSTTSDAALSQLPVARLAAKDAVLFMWGTWPTLPVNLATMAAWGFTYKTLGFLWVKTNTKAGTPFWGGGFWTRSNSEFCLLGIRGDIRRIDAGVHQLVETWGDVGETKDLVLRVPIGEHSAKPPEVRDRIIKLMGDLPAIELFAREKVALWDCWGNECDSDVDMTLSSGITVSTDLNVNANADDNAVQPQQQENEMANLPKALADKVGEARTSGGGNYIQHGDYIFMFGKWEFQHIQDDCIICEFFVGESRKKLVYEGTKAVETEPNALGSVCSDVANFDGPGKLSAPANSRAPVLGLFGFKEGEVPNSKISDTLSYVTSDAQPAKGMLIKCTTFSKEKKQTKGEYITGRSYECVAKPGEGLNSAEMVKARLDALAISPEAAVAVIQQQLATARGATPTAPTLSAPVAAPSIPAPPIAVAPPAPMAIPDGWIRHPQAPGHFYKGNEVKSEADLMAGR